MVRDQAFDRDGRLAYLQYSSAGAGGQVLEFNTSYGKPGQLLGIVEADGTEVTYTYDKSYQLTRDQRGGVNGFHTTYTYDGAGNRLSEGNAGTYTTYAYDAANRLIQKSVAGSLTEYRYDGNGNRIEANTGGSRTTYTWDEEDRLTRITSPDGAVTDLEYSANGLRQQQVDAEGTTGFVWDGPNVLQQVDGSGQATAQFTDFPGVWGGLTSVRDLTAITNRRASFNEALFNVVRFNQSGIVPGISHFYAFDTQGNTRLLTSGDGSISDSYLNQAFGEEIEAEGDTSNLYRFGGLYGYQDLGADLLYVRARLLDTANGRWLSEDPVWFNGGDWNLFRYVGNVPTLYADPSGLWGQHLHISMTKNLAERVYLASSSGGKNCFASFPANFAIAAGSGSGEMDKLMNSAGNPYFMERFHFDTDPGPADSRLVFMKQQRRIANDLAHQKAVVGEAKYFTYGSFIGPSPAALCKEAMRQLGFGLHAVQDIGAHMDLSPAEHMDRRQRTAVDHPAWNRLTRFKWDHYQHDWDYFAGPQSPAGQGWWNELNRRAASGLTRAYNRTGGARTGLMHEKIRIFEWGQQAFLEPDPADPWLLKMRANKYRNPRVQKSLRQTTFFLCQFLKMAQRTPCVKKTCDRPRPSKGISCN